jgi:hypothetical protein
LNLSLKYENDSMMDNELVELNMIDRQVMLIEHYLLLML